jgi:hypothetical protein
MLKTSSVNLANLCRTGRQKSDKNLGVRSSIFCFSTRIVSGNRPSQQPNLRKFPATPLDGAVFRAPAGIFKTGFVKNPEFSGTRLQTKSFTENWFCVRQPRVLCRRPGLDERNGFAHLASIHHTIRLLNALVTMSGRSL